MDNPLERNAALAVEDRLIGGDLRSLAVHQNDAFIDRHVAEQCNYPIFSQTHAVTIQVTYHGASPVA